MSSFVIHLLIPILVVLATGIVRPRVAWTWSWPAWAGDIDYVGWMLYVEYGTPNFHRALFHNVWWLALGVGLAAWAWRKWHAASGRSFADWVQARPGWVLVPFFYASHLILDVFAGGIVPFWPVSNLSVYWDFRIDVDTTKPVPQPEVVSQPGTYVGVPEVSRIYTWMTDEQWAMFLLYAVAFVLSLAYQAYARRTGRSLPDSAEA